jgi:hypothetical protein
VVFIAAPGDETNLNEKQHNIKRTNYFLREPILIIFLFLTS